MEPIVDFGLFELGVASGLAWIARKMYARHDLAVGVLLIGVVAPVVLVIISRDELSRWLAAVCLMTTLLNVAVLFPLVRSKTLPALLGKVATGDVLRTPEIQVRSIQGTTDHNLL